MSVPAVQCGIDVEHSEGNPTDGGSEIMLFILNKVLFVTLFIFLFAVNLCWVTNSFTYAYYVYNISIPVCS